VDRAALARDRALDARLRHPGGSPASPAPIDGLVSLALTALATPALAADEPFFLLIP
jgi:hypothetical protein